MKPGDAIWIPCDVKPGPFSNERMVRVESEAGEWLGFVNIEWLKAPAPEEGRSEIKALVVRVTDNDVIARLPGIQAHPEDRMAYRTSKQSVTGSGHIQA